MAVRERLILCDQQPQGPAKVAETPLGRNLVHALLTSFGGFDPASSRTVTVGGVAGVAKDGLIRAQTGTQKAFTIADFPEQRASQITLWVRARRTATAASFHSLFGKNWQSNSASTFVSYGITCNPSGLGQNVFTADHGYSGGILQINSSVTDSTQWNDICIRIDPRGLYLFFNGRQATFSTAQASSPISYGASGDNSFGTNFTGTSAGFDFAAAYLFNRGLEAFEIASLTDNPWQLFEDQVIAVPVVVAGGGNNQSIAFTLDGVSAAVSQTLSHSQSLTGTLDGVTVSASQTVQHSQALSATLDGVTFAAAQVGNHPQSLAATLDGITFAASQTLGNATNQTLAVTLDGVTVAAAQTLNHSQALAASLDGVTVAASQTLSHSQALAATLDGITVAISQSAAPSSKDQSLAITLDGVQVAIAQEGPASLMDTHDGFWAKEWARIRAREKRKHREEIEERIEVIADEIAEVEQQIVEVKQAPKPKNATPARDFYAEQARIVEHLISRRNQLIDEEDEELLLLL